VPAANPDLADASSPADAGGAPDGVPGPDRSTADALADAPAPDTDAVRPDADLGPDTAQDASDGPRGPWPPLPTDVMAVVLGPNMQSSFFVYNFIAGSHDRCGTRPLGDCELLDCLGPDGAPSTAPRSGYDLGLLTLTGTSHDPISITPGLDDIYAQVGRAGLNWWESGEPVSLRGAGSGDVGPLLLQGTMPAPLQMLDPAPGNRPDAGRGRPGPQLDAHRGDGEPGARPVHPDLPRGGERPGPAAPLQRQLLPARFAVMPGVSCTRYLLFSSC
jgi:hypothetical protein